MNCDYIERFAYTSDFQKDNSEIDKLNFMHLSNLKYLGMTIYSQKMKQFNDFEFNKFMKLKELSIGNLNHNYCIFQSLLNKIKKLNLKKLTLYSQIHGQNYGQDLVTLLSQF